MKVHIGPYINWFGPYQLADILTKFGVSEERCFDIGRRLNKTWLKPVLERIYSWRQRKIKIRIDKYDTWNMQDTLALIILPMLKQLKETTHGSPYVDDEDVPEHLRSTSAPPKEGEHELDAFHHDRWTWVLDEMIWTFEQFNTDWEAQYHSGVHDYIFEKTGKTMLNPITGKEEELSEMKHGPNHTAEVDMDGLTAHRKRIDNGTRLFGRYYSNLWD